MRVSTEQWRKIQQAIKDGVLTMLIEDMMDDAYEEGKLMGVEIGRDEMRPE